MMFSLLDSSSCFWGLIAREEAGRKALHLIIARHCPQSPFGEGLPELQVPGLVFAAAINSTFLHSRKSHCIDSICLNGLWPPTMTGLFHFTSSVLTVLTHSHCYVVFYGLQLIKWYLIVKVSTSIVWGLFKKSMDLCCLLKLRPMPFSSTHFSIFRLDKSCKKSQLTLNGLKWIWHKCWSPQKTALQSNQCLIQASCWGLNWCRVGAWQYNDAKGPGRWMTLMSAERQCPMVPSSARHPSLAPAKMAHGAPCQINHAELPCIFCLVAFGSILKGIKPIHSDAHLSTSHSAPLMAMRFALVCFHKFIDAICHKAPTFCLCGIINLQLRGAWLLNWFASILQTISSFAHSVPPVFDSTSWRIEKILKLCFPIWRPWGG